MTAATLVRPDAELQPDAGLDDPRLQAWRLMLTEALGDALRRYRVAWSDESLDDAARTVVGIGLLGHDPRATARAPAPRLPDTGRLAHLVSVVGLDAGSEAVIAGAWWATVDPQVAVAFGCVHDDATRRYPSLGVLAQVLAAYGVTVPLHLGPEHPLVAAGLIDPVPAPDVPVRLPATTNALLGAPSRAASPAAETRPRLADVVTRAAALIDGGARVLVRCEAPDDRVLVRDAVAARLDVAVADTPRPPTVAALLLRLRRELPAVVLDGNEIPDGTVLAVGMAPHATAPGGWQILHQPAPTPEAAETCWRMALRRAKVRVSSADVVAVAGRLPLPERTIDDVVAAAATAATVTGRTPTLGDVVTALQAKTARDPGGLARRRPVDTALPDLVLGAGTRQGLDGVVAHARFSAAAQSRLGLSGARGRAVICLFHGPSGTGKTAAAEAVAAEIGAELWVVDLAKVVSKWLGETQRNLDTVLTEAASAGVVLLFDEAEGLFGKRGEVTDARDRYANLEIDHLLQRVEAHTGVVVLTSNRPAAIDEAFARRIRLSVRFDLPDHEQREEIWRRYLPDALLDDAGSRTSAAREEISGAAIRAATVAATVSAIADGTAVTAAHIDTAVRRELEKSRRLPTGRAAMP